MTWVAVDLVMRMMQERPKGVRDSLFLDWLKWRTEFEPEGMNPAWSCHIILEGVKYKIKYKKRRLHIWNEKWVSTEAIVFTEFANYPTLLINLLRLQTELDELMVKGMMEE